VSTLLTGVTDYIQNMEVLVGQSVERGIQSRRGVVKDWSMIISESWSLQSATFTTCMHITFVL
jgi:hypothetical protein